MKTKMIMLAAVLMSFAASALAADKWELDDRIRSLTAKFAALEQNPEKMAPPDVLRQACGIILLDRTKAGFIFAYQGGGGIAMARDPGTGRWGPAAFVSANEGSLGFQIGAEQNFFVILLMNTNANRYLTEPDFQYGAEARGTAGDTSAGASINGSWREHPVLVYGERKGMFGSAAVKAGAITPAEDANHLYYDRYVTMKDILFDHVVAPSQSALDLAATINAYSAPPTVSR